MKPSSRFKLLTTLQATVAAALVLAAPARADINVGVVLSLTGPAASLGIPEENALKLWPRELGGQKARFIVLNDNSDTNAATQATQRLISEHNVDVILGSSVTPVSMAVVQVAGTAGVPVISMAGGNAIVLPQDGPRKWAFKLSPTETISATMVLNHLLQRGGKTMAAMVLANSYGEGFLKVTQEVAAAKGVKLVAVEKYAANDASVTAQVAKLMAANPDAVYVLSAGTAGATPQIELAKRGYKGAVYQTQGVANNDYLRVGGKDLEGTYMTVAPVLVADQLPDGNPVKKPGVAFLQGYEGKYGAGTRSLFGATMWDGLLILDHAVAKVGNSAQPGTPQYRAALRDAIEATKEFVASQGVFNMSPTDHNGVDQRSQVMVRIEGGAWKLQP